MAFNDGQPRVGSAALIFNEEGSVLLGSRRYGPAQDMFVLPGGGVREFETIENAVIREVAEETGLTITVVRRLGLFEHIDPPEHRIVIVNMARVISGIPRDSNELSKVGFYAQAGAMNLSPFVRRIFRELTDRAITEAILALPSAI